MRRAIGIRMVVLAGALAAVSGAGAGCSNDNEAAENGAAGTGGFAGTGNRAGTGGTGGTTAASAGASGTAAAALTDGQIAAIMLDANSGEVQAAQVALSRSNTSAIQTFANRMVTDHSAASAALQSVLNAANITAADSAQRQTLANQTTQALNTLWAAPAASFDAAYAQSQVTMHQAVMQLLQSQLIPHVQNAALKSELQSELAAVMSHLADAQQLAAQFPTSTAGGGTTTADGGTTTGTAGTTGTTGTAGRSGTGSGPGTYTGTGH
jgi:putative membrane protein